MHEKYNSFKGNGRKTYIGLPSRLGRAFGAIKGQGERPTMGSQDKKRESLRELAGRGISLKGNEFCVNHYRHGRQKLNRELRLKKKVLARSYKLRADVRLDKVRTTQWGERAMRVTGPIREQRHAVPVDHKAIK